MTEEAILAFRRDFEAIEQEIGKAIIGQKTLIRDVLTVWSPEETCFWRVCPAWAKLSW